MGFSRRTLAIATVVIILLGALGGIYVRLKALQAEDESGEVAANGDEDRPDVESAQAFRSDISIPVSAAPVLRDTLVMSVSAAGQAQAYARALLVAEVDGSVTEVLVREGDHVRQGEVLARIDPERYEFELERARARLEQAQANFAELTLFDDEIEDEELRSERRRMARARSGLTEAEVAVREAELNVRRATVRAPFTGNVANMAVVPGERLVAQRDSIAEVVDLSRMRIEVQVLETEVPFLEDGREAQVTLSAFPDTVLRGRVESINPVIDPRTRTARVTVLLPNPEGEVKPGMYARVRIAARLYENRTMVPRSSILERDNRTLVFLFEPEQGSTGLAKWTYVTTGLENEDFVEIVPGEGTTMLEPGQLVLTDGHYTLIHDARVRVTEDAEDAEG
ncbi:MAG TPA: efflux RND transporter periplasmic adaptor subunit [Gemmatimonadota bacterium]|nr:efflux RND transporter periplasmic adaptor subunit [Gemmatimonadota bacterium]